jgi:hypothetical protein
MIQEEGLYVNNMHNIVEEHLRQKPWTKGPLYVPMYAWSYCSMLMVFFLIECIRAKPGRVASKINTSILFRNGKVITIPLADVGTYAWKSGFHPSTIYEPL